MSRARDAALLLAGLAIGGGVTFAIRSREAPSVVAAPAKPAPQVAPQVAPIAPIAQASPAPAPRARPSRVEHVVVGGGPTPELNQVSIEQDTELLASSLPADTTLVLFGAGANSPSVQVLDAERRGDVLEQTLADFLGARGGREAHYRAATLSSNGPATERAVREGLGLAFSGDPGPRALFFVGHGDRGDTRKNNAFFLWGEESLTVTELAAFLEAHPSHETAVVMTSCFSGGFADLIFSQADFTKPLAEHLGCGLFATTWDREASGCDPNPDRAAQDGYSVALFEAISGRTREGAELDDAAIDFDGDRAISLAEAHTYAAIVSGSLDIPVRTSERLLEIAAPMRGPRLAVALPETRALLAALLDGLELAGAEDAEVALRQLAETRARLDAQLAERRTEEERAYRDAVYALLARYPVLDDPWHPDYAETLEAHREDLEHFFDSDARLAAWTSLHDRLASLEAQRSDLDAQEAPLARIVHASRTIERAERLAASRSPALRRFDELRHCEARTIRRLRP